MNAVTGTLPPSLGLLTQLTYLCGSRARARARARAFAHARLRQRRERQPAHGPAADVARPTHAARAVVRARSPPVAHGLTYASSCRYVFDNEFSHALPSSLGALARVFKFYADSNALSGTLPDSLSGMTALRELYARESGTALRLTRASACAQEHACQRAERLAARIVHVADAAHVHVCSRVDARGAPSLAPPLTAGASPARCTATR